jgi:hypothetical protein
LIAGHAKHKTEGVGNTTLSHQSIDNHGPKCRACPGFDPVFEHRLFRHITRASRSKLLTSHQTAIELIASTTTRTGLTVRHEPGTSTDPKAIKATAGEMAILTIKGDTFHPGWTYTMPSRLSP